MVQQPRMLRAEFYAQAEIAHALDDETARKQAELYQEIGREALIRIFAPNGDNQAAVFWTQTQWKLHEDDVIGPHFTHHADGVARRGIAVWRLNKQYPRQSSDDRVE